MLIQFVGSRLIGMKQEMSGRYLAKWVGVEYERME